MPQPGGSRLVGCDLRQAERIDIGETAVAFALAKGLDQVGQIAAELLKFPRLDTESDRRGGAVPAGNVGSVVQRFLIRVEAGRGQIGVRAWCF